MTEWVLIVLVVLMKPVTDGGPEVPGDIVYSNLIGSAATLEKCQEGGNLLVETFNHTGQGSTKSYYKCVKMDADDIDTISRYQDWKQINE